VVAQSNPGYTRIAKINIPTLVVHGTKDQIIPFEHGMKLAEMIKGSSVLWLKDAGHIFPLPAMEDFSMKLIEFLNEVKKINNGGK
jgi:pimeloyl-ACP methyl ester carboxylesterase